MERPPRAFEPEDRARLLQYVRANTVSNLSFAIGLLVMYLTVLRSGWVLLLAGVAATVIALVGWHANAILTRAAEQAYYKKTGMFPIMHMMAVRRSLAEQYPWLAGNILKACLTARGLAAEEMKSTGMFYAMLPWLSDDLARAHAVMGPNMWPYGVTANRRELEAMLRWSHEQGLAPRVGTAHVITSALVRGRDPDDGRHTAGLGRKQDGVTQGARAVQQGVVQPVVAHVNRGVLAAHTGGRAVGGAEIDHRSGLLGVQLPVHRTHHRLDHKLDDGGPAR